MPKNDMSAFKRTKSTSILANAPKAPKPTKEKKPAGKPKKTEEEKLSKRVQILLSPSEFEKLENDRGGVPVSAFLRGKLKDAKAI